MGELLANEVTKKSLTEFLIKKVIEHLKLQNIDFIAVGNRQTFSSLSGQIVVDNNNNVLFSHFLRTPLSMYILQTDVFFILLNHCHIFNCSHLFQHLVCGLVYIKSIHQTLGQTCASALLTLHSLTGCDTTGRFALFQVVIQREDLHSLTCCDTTGRFALFDRL